MPAEYSGNRAVKVAVVFGTRPEAIKVAPVIKALQAASDFECATISTGQHKEMLAQVLELFEIQPDCDLQVMRHDQSLSGLTARLSEAIGDALDKVKPDVTLVQGDTTTALVGALCSFYAGIPVGHIEAGLRTDSLFTPFPEEANRRLISTLSTFHFCPTEKNLQQLRLEETSKALSSVTGNTVIDALQMEVRRQEQTGDRERLREVLAKSIGPNWWQDPYILLTTHRRENLGSGLEQICEAIQVLATRLPDEFQVIATVHKNPNVREVLERELAGNPRVRLIEPQPYSEFLALMRDSTLILSDSGGVQEEAPALGKPVLVLRETTERTEGVEAGTVRLVGTNSDAIVSSTMRLVSSVEEYESMARALNPYGDGQASARILEILRSSKQA